MDGVGAGDDLGGSYVAYRQRSAVDAAEARLRALTGEQPAQADPAAAQPAAPASPDAAPAAQPAADPARRDTGALRLLKGAGAVARNVGEIPGQAAAGVLDAVREAFKASDDVADWLNQQVPLSGVQPGDPSTPGRTIARNIPEIAQPDTPAGKFTREVSQFLFGFWRGGQALKAAGVAQGAGAAATAARGLTAGAIADGMFQEVDEGNLANLWQSAGLPPNALTDFLAARPGDDAAENRLRNALSGAGLGATLETAIAVAKLGRAAVLRRRAADPAAAAPEPRTAVEAAGLTAVPERDILLLGDPNRPLVEVQRAANLEAGRTTQKMMRAIDATEAGVPDQVAAKGIAGEAAAAADPIGGEVFINWGRIATADDVKAVMRDMAGAFKGAVDQARRGVQSNEATAELAAKLGLTPEDLLKRRRGEPWNAETALAARQLYAASGQQLLAAARRASAADASPLDQVAFRKMMATHYAIQAEVLAARTETARALQSWAIPAGAGREQLKSIEQLLESAGGASTSSAMARRLMLIAENAADPEAAIAQFTRRGWGGATLEAVQEVFINSLLSSPGTHLANITGNQLNAFLQILERGTAGAISRTVGSGEIAPGEAIAMSYGMVTGLRDAFRLVAKSWRGEGDELAQAIGKIDAPRDPAVSARAFGIDEGSGLGKAIDVLGHSVVRAPGRALGAEDAFFKSINHRMALHAASMREAQQQLALAGEAVTAESLGRKMGEIMRDPPESVRLEAADAALYATFNREAGPLAQRLLALRNSDSPAVNLSVALLLPFIRTPANILSYSFERTPLAPLVGQWRADIAAGGVRRDLALARVATGTTVMGMMFDLADRGLVTGKGPDDAGERANYTRLGVQPYSVKVGDQWVSLNRLDPFGFFLGFAGDLADMMRRSDIEPEEVDEIQELMAAGAVTVSRAVLDRTWMRGFSEFMSAMDEDRPNPERWIASLASGFVPAGSGALARAIDPTARTSLGVEEALMAKIPGLSQKLLPRRDVWGQPVRTGLTEIAGSETAANIYNAVTPTRTQTLKDSPIDRELVRLNLGVSPIGTRVEFDGAAVNLREFPQALDDYRRLAGNELKHPVFKLGLKDLLDAIVEGDASRGRNLGPVIRAYERGTDGKEGGKSEIIRGLVQDMRELARMEVLKDPKHGELLDLVRARQGERVEKRTGQAPRLQ
jgi:hypothetical protein